MKYKIIIDIAPGTIQGTNGCHRYVFGRYGTLKEALRVVEEINQVGTMGRATVEKAND